MMSQRAILVSGSRLMRELIRNVIEKRSGFEVIRELDSMQDLPSAITETNADYLFVMLPLGKEMPETWKSEVFLRKPTLKIVGLWVDGSHVRLEWLAREQKDFTGSTLDELTRFLRDELHSIQDMEEHGRNETG